MLKKTLLSAVLASATTLAFAQSTGSIGGSNSDSRQQGSSQNDPTRGATGALGGSDTGATRGGTGTLQNFTSLDTDRDGALSRDEIRSVNGLTSRFQQLDTDRSGTLSNSEFSKFEVGGSASGGGYGASGSAGSDGVQGSTTTPDSKSSASGRAEKR